MAVATLEDYDIDSLRMLPSELLRQVSAAATLPELLGALVQQLDCHAAPAAMFYFQRNEQGELADTIRLRAPEGAGAGRLLHRQLLTACQAACRAGELSVRQETTPARMVVAAPIVLSDRDPEALGVVFASDKGNAQRLMLTQMIASHIVLWHVVAGSRNQEADAREAAALIELVDLVTAAPDLRQACYTLVGELADFLNCRRVAVGLRSGSQGRCRLVAVSGVARYDKRSSTAHALEAALDEAVLRNDLTVWPPADDQHRHAALAHKRICSLEDTQSVVSTPLRDDHDDAVGALLAFHDTDALPADSERFLRAAARSLARSLVVARRLEGGRCGRWARGMGRWWHTWKGKVALAAGGLVFVAMMIPLPYKVHCDCQIEPVTRRFVAAPFQGTLEKSLVEPGDIVRKGDVLVRLDGREVRWKRAGVVADRNQAMKRRDAAQAGHDYADQQIAQLEMERLDLELELLDYRAENLEVKSPVDGIVASGDLERAEGAPLTIGQTLFEIAPLEAMIVEVAVPDDEVSHIAAGQTIEIRLDAYPRQTWQAEVARIQTRSEIRDQKNVFITEAEMENTDARLRPGMKGRAKVVTRKHPLGWVLFHKSWEYVTKKLSW